MKFLNIKETKSTLLIFLTHCMKNQEKNVETNARTFEKNTFVRNWNKKTL